MRAAAWLAITMILLAAASAGHGEIVFIDLNDNAKEIAAAQRAAEARGEELTIVSTVTPEQQKIVSDARTAYSRALSTQTKSCAAGASDGCSVATAKAEKVDLDLRTTLQNVPKMNAVALGQAFAALKADGKEISTLIVSGHDGDRQLWGTYGDFDDNDLEKALLKNKPLGDTIKSFYVWGCYSATTDDFMHGWKRAFPATTMLAGFSGQAPLGSRPESGQMLEDLLEKESQLRGETDPEKLKEIFDSIRAMNDLNNPSLAVCLDRKTVISRGHGVRTVQDDINACSRRSTEETHWSTVYQCYLRGKPGCESIPSETDERSPLRQVYDYFQETKHCDEVLRNLGRQREITASGVRRLLFDNTVRKNFEKLHKSELEAMNHLMDTLGLPAELRVRGLGKMSRKAYLDLLKGIKNQWNLRMEEQRADDGKVRDANVIALGKYLEEIDKVESGSCVPLSWVEDDEQLKPSSCGIKAGMQNAIANARAEVLKLDASSNGTQNEKSSTHR